MTQDADKLSLVTSKALDFIFAKHPERTSLGVVLGLVLAFLSTLFLPYLSTLEFVDFRTVPAWGWIPVGIIITHVPTVLSFVINKPIADEKVEEIMRIIEKGGFTAIEKKQRYRELIAKTMDNVGLNKETFKQIQIIKKELSVLKKVIQKMNSDA